MSSAHQKFRASSPRALEAFGDGWLRTGDKGWLDKDAGRMIDLISPREGAWDACRRTDRER